MGRRRLIIATDGWSCYLPARHIKVLNYTSYLASRVRQAHTKKNYSNHCYTPPHYRGRPHLIKVQQYAPKIKPIFSKPILPKMSSSHNPPHNPNKHSSDPLVPKHGFQSTDQFASKHTHLLPLSSPTTPSKPATTPTSYPPTFTEDKEWHQLRSQRQSSTPEAIKSLPPR
jgi:hypothetical protein